MALIKTICMLFPGEDIPRQIEVEMGPLEEAATLADWELGKHVVQKPTPLTDSEKLEALLDPTLGVAHIHQKQKEYDSKLSDHTNIHNKLADILSKKWDEYHQKMYTLPEDTHTC